MTNTPPLDLLKEVLLILDEVLCLKGRMADTARDAPLLGAIPELDSMAVVAVITTLEERFGIAVADDDLDASTFATVGALTDFVASKVDT